MEVKKVLLISAHKADRIVDALTRANARVLFAKDGQSALGIAKHARVDVVVLMGSNKIMDRTETALNLRDISPDSEIIFVTRHRNRLTRGEIAAMEIPNTKVLTPQEFESYLGRER